MRRLAFARQLQLQIDRLHRLVVGGVAKHRSAQCLDRLFPAIIAIRHRGVDAGDDRCPPWSERSVHGKVIEGSYFRPETRLTDGAGGICELKCVLQHPEVGKSAFRAPHF